ncbi:hypothetical protein [Streptomyces sp. NPDC050145]|uniref:hypothetical protein n=1 Tax=Streptomyces sp. NPDC050145 TaxID=3365602 RepID=UPI0037ABDFD7
MPAHSDGLAPMRIGSHHAVRTGPLPLRHAPLVPAGPAGAVRQTPPPRQGASVSAHGEPASPAVGRVCACVFLLLLPGATYAPAAIAVPLRTLLATARVPLPTAIPAATVATGVVPHPACRAAVPGW